MQTDSHTGGLPPPPARDGEGETCFAHLLCSQNVVLGWIFLSLPFMLVLLWLEKFTVWLCCHTHAVTSPPVLVVEADEVCWALLSLFSLSLGREHCRLHTEGLPKTKPQIKHSKLSHSICNTSFQYLCLQPPAPVSESLGDECNK